MAEAILRDGTTRTQRGIQLWRDQGDNIERVAPSVYDVPSCSSNETYKVWLDLQACSCPDHKQAKFLGVRCKHVIAATIYRAKK